MAATTNGTISKIAIPPTASGTDPDLQNAITAALLHNGGVARIQRTLQQRLDEAGWSQNLREYTERLFRSGEAYTFDEAIAKVMQQIRGGTGAARGGDGVAAGEGMPPDLGIPREAKEGGVEVVRRELEGILVLKK